MTKTAPKFKVGDHVRLSTAKGVFEKGYIANWTEEVFRVKAVDRRKLPMFTVEDAKQQEIQGRFYSLHRGVAKSQQCVNKVEGITEKNAKRDFQVLFPCWR